VSALQTSDWLVSGTVVGGAVGEVGGCVRQWCERSGGYEVWMDALVRVSYLGLQATLATETVAVSVPCPDSPPHIEAADVTEAADER